MIPNPGVVMGGLVGFKKLFQIISVKNLQAIHSVPGIEQDFFK